MNEVPFCYTKGDLSAVFTWRNSTPLLENIAKIMFVGEIKRIGNFLNTQSRIFKQILCGYDFPVKNIGINRCSKL